MEEKILFIHSDCKVSLILKDKASDLNFKIVDLKTTKNNYGVEVKRVPHMSIPGNVDLIGEECFNYIKSFEDVPPKSSKRRSKYENMFIAPADPKKKERVLLNND